MQSAQVIGMRREYAALVRIADGLIEMIHARASCNILTFARMAEEARSAARHLASEIERMLTQEKPEPQKRRGLWEAVKEAVKQLQAFCACL